MAGVAAGRARFKKNDLPGSFVARLLAPAQPCSIQPCHVVFNEKQEQPVNGSWVKARRFILAIDQLVAGDEPLNLKIGRI
jgi:hypothetical protein